MDIKISKEKLKKTLEKLIQSEFELIKTESDEWGLGEMQELYELQTITKIEVNYINVLTESIEIYIDIYVEHIPKYTDYQDIRAVLDYRLEKWFPSTNIFINEIIE